MCKQGLELESESLNSQNQAVGGMENSLATADDVPRVKFLCSFGGSILPRPQDGKLRYVGGETRIVSVSRDIKFVELMAKMKELFDSVSLLKYQQPDEDLDALVSVVNDDDVINMMEEYDKFGQGDGFTRLRMFLFSHPDDDASLFDTDERETQRRYVDALNSLSDPSDFSRQSEVSGQSDRLQLAEQFFNSMHFDNMRNCEVVVPQYNAHPIGVLHQPLIGHCNGSVVYQEHEVGFQGLPQIKPLGVASGREVQPQMHTPRYNEMEMPWSPAYYSSGHQPSSDSRAVSELCSSPSTGRYRMAFDLHERAFDECSNGQNVGPFAAANHQTAYDHPAALVDNLPQMQQGTAVAAECNGIQVPAGNQQPVFDGTSKCEPSHFALMRNQTFLESHYPDGRWKHIHTQLDQASESTKFCDRCREYYSRKETILFNGDVKENGVYSKDQNESHHNLGECYGHERGWIAHRLNNWPDESRNHISGPRRNNERNVPFPPSCHDNLALPLNYMNHEDPHHINSIGEFNNEGSVGLVPHMQSPVLDDIGMGYGNFAPVSSKDDQFHGPLGPAYTLHKIGPAQQPNCALNSGFLDTAPVGSPRLSCVLPDNDNTRILQSGSPHTINPFDASSADHALYMNRNVVNEQNYTMLHFDGGKEPNAGAAGGCMEAVVDAGCVSPNCQKPVNLSQNNRGSNFLAPISIQPQGDLIGFAESKEPQDATISSISQTHDTVGSPISASPLKNNMDAIGSERLAETEMTVQEVYQPKQAAISIEPDARGTHIPNSSDGVRPGPGDALDSSKKVELSSECLSLIPELMASMKKAKLEGLQQIQGRGGDGSDVHKEQNHAGEAPDADSLRSSLHEDEDLNSDHPKASKIEMTSAEAEALERGLQMIKNSDLEEIRELGSGTYGSVYHGKWKGSDVAIKRIKPSCFAGRPSERERLIADFWKEALILSSLHHPNVVSFYGVVRDGPEGSLATVTEFMVNGSLKQVLQKKDRTIDRRKRLIIAMDASFGMEYLHGKNIVHFDLKCENLLVNMKDPHRPVCKIGDLGLSKVRQHTLVSGGIRGTLPWMAPELLNGKNNMVTEKVSNP
ncbi:Serine/threonine-protein kinase [Nymphaea thermarum]|nr:Serine/threonine-protein kinase [Nymphaea thermarum]